MPFFLQLLGAVVANSFVVPPSHVKIDSAHKKERVKKRTVASLFMLCVSAVN